MIYGELKVVKKNEQRSVNYVLILEILQLRTLQYLCYLGK